MAWFYECRCTFGCIGGGNLDGGGTLSFVGGRRAQILDLDEIGGGGGGGCDHDSGSEWYVDRGIRGIVWWDIEEFRLFLGTLAREGLCR